MDGKEHKEIDVKKYIDYLKLVTQSMSLGRDVRKEMKNIVRQFTSDGRHRLIKIFSYAIMKEFSDLDFDDIRGTVSGDIASTDSELQLNAIKLLYNFPIDSQIALLRAHTSDFQKMLHVPDFHHEKLICLSDVLLKCYLKSSLSEDNANDVVRELFVKIAELIFHASRDFASTAISILSNVYHQYKTLSFDVYKQDKFFDGNGQIDMVFKPLMIRLTNFLFPNFDQIVQLVHGFELRTRANLMTFPVLLLEVSLDLFCEHYQYENADLLAVLGKKDIHFVMTNEIAVPLKEVFNELVREILMKDVGLMTYEVDVWLPTYTNILSLLNICNKQQWNWIIKKEESNEMLKNLFVTFVESLYKTYFKRESNTIMFNFATLSRTLNPSYKLYFSMKILELTERLIQNPISRFLLYLTCFVNIVNVSIDLLESGKKSAILGMFNQGWFIQKIQDKEDRSSVSFKEEFLVCLIKACIFVQYDLVKRNKSLYTFIEILLEVLDLCTRVIDWKMEYQNYSEYQRNSYLFALDLYFILLEDVYDLAQKDKLKTHIRELINRVNAKELAPDVKLKLINSLANKIDAKEMEQLDLDNLITEFKDILINKSTKTVFEEIFIHKLPGSFILKNFILQVEYILDTLYHAAFKSSEKKRQDIITLLTDYQEYLLEFTKDQKYFYPLVQSVLDYNAMITSFIMNKEVADVGEMKITTNFLDRIEFAIDEDYDETESYGSFKNLSYAFNIYYMKLYNNNEIFEYDILEKTNPMENLCYLAQRHKNLDETNYRSREPTLISGMGDLVQIYARHAIDASHSLLSINLRIINVNKFMIDKIKVESLYPDNLAIYPEVTNKKFAELVEMGQNNDQEIFFCYEVRRSVDVNITFELFFDIQEIDDPVSFKTLPYKISFTEFLAPNYMMCTQAKIFENIWRTIPYDVSLKALMLVSHEDILERLMKKKFYIKLKEQTKEGQWKKIYLLAYTWDDNSIGMVISDDSTEINTDKRTVTIEVRSSNMEIIQNIRDEGKIFVDIIGEKTLKFQY